MAQNYLNFKVQIDFLWLVISFRMEMKKKKKKSCAKIKLEIEKRKHQWKYVSYYRKRDANNHNLKTSLEDVSNKTEACGKIFYLASNVTNCSKFLYPALWSENDDMWKMMGLSAGAQKSSRKRKKKIHAAVSNVTTPTSMSLSTHTSFRLYLPTTHPIKCIHVCKKVHIH